MNARLLAISPGVLEDEDAQAFLAPAARARAAGLGALRRWHDTCAIFSAETRRAWT